jgi:hypothetical protein
MYSFFRDDFNVIKAKKEEGSFHEEEMAKVIYMHGLIKSIDNN